MGAAHPALEFALGFALLSGVSMLAVAGLLLELAIGTVRWALGGVLIDELAGAGEVDDPLNGGAHGL
jgi:hypothetical protein